MQISAHKRCAAFIRAVRKAGFGGTQYNVPVVGTAALAKALGADARGVVVSQVMPVPFSPLTPLTPLAAEYLAAGKAALGARLEPNDSSIEGCVAAKVLSEGQCRGGASVNPVGLVTALESMREVNLGGFYADLSPAKHPGSRFVDLTSLTADGWVRR